VATLIVRGRLEPAGAPVDVVVERGAIAAVRPAGAGPALGDATCLLGEAFFDLEVNGFAGVDFNRPALTAEELHRAMATMWRHGVARFLVTAITAPLPQLEAMLRAVAQAREEDAALAYAIPGIHLEGPFLAPEDGPRGAHPAGAILDPDWDVLQRLQEASRGLIRLVTLAPERPGAIGLIWQLCEAGIVVAIGHTDAADRDIELAVEAGARLSTHLGNGAHAVLPRHRNYLQKQLATDALMASLICDGHHLPDYVVQNIIRCKTPERVILVTDAMAAAAAPPGEYRLGQVVAKAGRDGYVRLPGTPYLAGSALTLDRAVDNAARFAQLPIHVAMGLASRQPRRLFPDLGTGISPGQPADLVVVRPGSPLALLATVVRGEVVYTAEGGSQCPSGNAGLLTADSARPNVTPGS